MSIIDDILLAVLVVGVFLVISVVFCFSVVWMDKVDPPPPEIRREATSLEKALIKIIFKIFALLGQ